MSRRAKCARGEDLTVPYAWIETNISQEQLSLLTGDEIDSLGPRLECINNSQWCFDHWLELLTKIDELIGNHQEDEDAAGRY